jgi:hypothetical protein
MTVYSDTERKFAWHPVKTHSGKRIWCRYYIRADSITLRYFGKKFLGSKIECRIFTESEWTLELLKV